MSAQPLPFVRPGERFSGGSGRGAGGNKFRPVVRPKGAPAPRPAPTSRPLPPRQEARSREEEPDGDDAQRREGQPSPLPQQQQEEQPEERRDNATTGDGEPKERRRSGGDEDIRGEGERTDDGDGVEGPTSILIAVNRRGGEDEGSGSMSPLSAPPSQEEQVGTGALLPQPSQSVSSSSIQGVRQEEQQASPLVQEERERVHQHQPSQAPQPSTLPLPPSQPESVSPPLSRASSQQRQQFLPRQSSPTLFFPLAPTAIASSPLPTQARSSLQPPPPATTSPDQHARASDTNPSLDLLADICQQRSLLQEQSPTSSAAIRQPFGGPSFSRARAVKSRKRTGHAQQGGGTLKGARGGAATGRGGKAAGKGRRKVLFESSEEEEELAVSDDLEEEGEAEVKEWDERAGMDDGEHNQQRRHDHRRRLLETEYESPDDDELGIDVGVDSREALGQIVRVGRSRAQRANGLDVLSAMASSDSRRPNDRSFSHAHTNGASHRRRRQREVGDEIMDDEWMEGGGGGGAYRDEPDATAAAKDLPRRVRVSAKKDTGEWTGDGGVQRGTDGMYEDEGPDAAADGKRGRRRTAGMGYAWREDADDFYVGDDADEEWRIGVDGSDGGGSSEDSDFGVPRKKKTKKKAAKKKSARQKRGGAGGGRRGRGGRGASSRRASARLDGESDEGEEHRTMNGDAEGGASSSAAAAATRKPRKKRAPGRTAESVADEEVMDETLLNGAGGEEEKADGEEGANGDADAAAGEKRPRRRRAAAKRTVRENKDSQDEGDDGVEEDGTEGGERTRKTARRKRKRAGSAGSQQPALDAATATLHARIQSYRNARLVQAAPGFKKLAVGGTQGGAQRSGRDGEERGPQQENQEEDGGLDASEARAGPQVELSATGEIIINQQSLQVAREEAQDEDAMEEVHEEAQQAATYTSFTTRTRTSRWTPEETKKFYMALRQCGTDFTTMELMFPTRDRAQLKNKFKKEERAHPELVYRYLDCQQPFDLQPFEASLGLLQVGQEKEQLQDGAAEAGDVGGSGAGLSGIDGAGEGDGGAGASAAAAGSTRTSDNCGAAANDDVSACADEDDGRLIGLPEGVSDSGDGAGAAATTAVGGGTGEQSNRDAASSRDADHSDNGARSGGTGDAPGRLVDAGGGEGGGVGAVDHEDDDGHEVVDDIIDDASDGVACAGLGDVVREDDDEYYDDVEGADADALTPGDVEEAWAE